jgi:malonyl-CoA/methylmalonyl-CoA synthetase
VVLQPGAAFDEGVAIAQLKRQLAAFKCPKRLLVVDALPRNAMGKVQKKQLREQHHALYA